jgi:hypothetical protein
MTRNGILLFLSTLWRSKDNIYISVLLLLLLLRNNLHIQFLYRSTEAEDGLT